MHQGVRRTSRWWFEHRGVGSPRWCIHRGVILRFYSNHNPLSLPPKGMSFRNGITINTTFIKFAYCLKNSPYLSICDRSYFLIWISPWKFKKWFGAWDSLMGWGDKVWWTPKLKNSPEAIFKDEIEDRKIWFSWEVSMNWQMGVQSVPSFSREPDLYVFNFPLWISPLFCTKNINVATLWQYKLTTNKLCKEHCYYMHCSI